MTDPLYDVIIVGAGPTGATAGNLLGQCGLSVLVVERHAATVSEPRAVVIDDEAMRTFQAVGLDEAVRRCVRVGNATRYFSKIGARHCFAEVNPQGNEFGFPKRLRFHQPDLERILHQGLRRFPRVEVLFDTACESFDAQEDGVSVRLRGTHGKAFTARSRYLLACDGGSSTIRQSLGIALTGETYEEPWLVLDLVDDPFDPDDTLIICDPRRPAVSVPGPGRRRRFEFLIKHGEDRQSFLRPEVIERLLAPYGYGAAHPAKIERKTIYVFHARSAVSWRRGRVLLAGDAAHLMPPFMGQGMNSCIRDAHNVCWKLEQVVRGLAGERMLDTYETERRPHVEAMINISVTVAELAMTTSRVKAALRDLAFRAARAIPAARRYLNGQMFKPRPQYAAGLFIAPSDNAPAPVAKMLPQPQVTWKGEVQPLDKVLGSGFALLGLGTEEIPRASDHLLWRQLQPTRLELSEEPRAADNSAAAIIQGGPLIDWLQRWRGRVLLVRPDRYVAGCFLPAEAHDFARNLAQRLQFRAPASSRVREATV